jgi:RND family efflux transporter MFP subunit
VSAIRVTRADLTRTITLSGEFQPYEEVELHAKVAGYVRSIRVDVGHHVKAGDTIAVLEIPELNDDLKKAAAATRAAREDMKRAQAHHDEVHIANQRLLQVAKERPNLVAQQDIDVATAEDLGSEAALASARQRIEESEANESRMHTMFAYGTITAPFDGVITRRYADTGALIQAGTASNTQAMPVVSLAEDRLLRLRFPVPESVVSFIREGTAVDVEVPALHRTFKGRVARYSGQVDRATRTMHTEVDVPNQDLRLTPGMYASVTIALEERPHALCLPVQALMGRSAFVVGEGDRVEKREVKVGLETPERVEVLEGLHEGDLVVVGGRGQLQPGDRVVPKVQGVEPVKEDGRS